MNNYQCKNDNDDNNTQNVTIDSNTNLRQCYNENVREEIWAKLESFQEVDSGWNLYEILHLKVDINKFNPISVGIPTTSFIKKTKSVINIKYDDVFCFLYLYYGYTLSRPKKLKLFTYIFISRFQRAFDFSKYQISNCLEWHVGLWWSAFSSCSKRNISIIGIS